MKALTTAPRYNENALSLSSDGRAVVKTFRGPGAARGIVERDVYRFLAANGYAYAPRLLDATETEAFVSLAIEHIEGAALSSAAAERPADLAELVRRFGVAVRAFHRLEPAPPLPARTAADVCARWDETLDVVVRHLTLGAPGGVSCARVRARFARDADDHARCFAPALIHRDLRFDNAIVDARDDLKIIDWEMSTVGHPELDLARLLWIELGDDEALVRPFLEGYGAAFPPERIAFFRILYLLEMLEYFSGRDALLPEEQPLRDRLVRALARYGEGEPPEG
jgi:aminoglycoside phosphotransferase (APT) family kinase protein